MYTPGKLIYFDPFFFKDGGSKPKFFLVLKIVEEKVILASLPSSKNHLPSSHISVPGCLEIPEAGISCYIFKAKKAITKSGWFFELDTYLYGFWIEDFSLKDLSENYSLEGVDYEIKGELTEEELRNIIQCFSTSENVKRKYKRWLAL